MFEQDSSWHFKNEKTSVHVCRDRYHTKPKKEVTGNVFLCSCRQIKTGMDFICEESLSVPSCTHTVLKNFPIQKSFYIKKYFNNILICEEDR